MRDRLHKLCRKVLGQKGENKLKVFKQSLDGPVRLTPGPENSL